MFKPAVGSEYLDALILTVGDINIAVAIGANVMRKVELAGTIPRLAP
jgi:hypothetical protein